MARITFRISRINSWENDEAYGVYISGSYRDNGGAKVLGGRASGVGKWGTIPLVDVTKDDLPVDEGEELTIESDACEFVARDEKLADGRVMRTHYITPLSSAAFPDFDDSEEDDDEEEEVVVPAPKAKAADKTGKTGKGKK